MIVRGFTLLEVLVALAVVALAMLALVQTGSRVAFNASGLQQRTLAHWVAQDVLTQTRLAQDWPELGQSDGETEQLAQTWYWALEVSQTEDADMRRLEVRVAERPGAEDHLARLDGFIGRIRQAGTPGLAP
ncbi:MAG: type II secretion system minor pseudopilin GspI [Gammaproteobacteria bacterium SHHR-1]